MLQETENQEHTKLADKVITWSRLSAIAIGPMLAVMTWLALQIYGDVRKSLNEITEQLRDNSLNILELQVQMIERTEDRYTGAQGRALEDEIQNLNNRLDNIQIDIDEIRRQIDG